MSQGRLALRAVYQFILDGTCPPPRIKVVPHIVMRSNLDLFLERLSVEADDIEQQTALSSTIGPAQPAPSALVPSGDQGDTPSRRATGVPRGR